MIHHQKFLQFFIEQSNTRKVASAPVLQQMPRSAQRRMVALMAKNTEGQLSPSEQSELAALVSVYEQMMISNSEALCQNQLNIAPAVD